MHNRTAESLVTQKFPLFRRFNSKKLSANAGFSAILQFAITGFYCTSKPNTPGSHQKYSNKIGQPYNCHQTKARFESSIKANLRVFQNHRKQAKINIVFYRFPLLGLSKPQICQLLPMKQLTEVKLT